MTQVNATWQEDWKARLVSRIRGKGWDTVTQFLATCPAVPYTIVARSIGNDVAAVQIEWMHFGEAQDAEAIRKAAMDSLAREMARHLPEGWRQVAKGDFITAKCCASWIVRIEQKQTELAPKAEAVWAALEKLSPPVGWSPAGPDDPLIVQPFSDGWPKGVGDTRP